MLSCYFLDNVHYTRASSAFIALNDFRFNKVLKSIL